MSQTNAGDLVGWGGIGASIAQNSISTSSRLGSNLKLYNGWRGNQYVTTFGLSSAAGKFGIGLAIAGVGIEGYQVFKGDVELGKFIIDSAFAGIGIIGGPAGAAVSAGWFIADPLICGPGGRNPAQDTQYIYVNGQKSIRCF